MGTDAVRNAREQGVAQSLASQRLCGFFVNSQGKNRRLPEKRKSALPALHYRDNASLDAVLTYGIGSGIVLRMPKERMKKLTVIVPQELLERATRASRSGVTPTVRMGLKLVAAQEAYARLRRLRGKVKRGMTWQEIRGDE